MPLFQKINAYERGIDAGYKAKAHFKPRARASSLQYTLMQHIYSK